MQHYAKTSCFRKSVVVVCLQFHYAFRAMSYHLLTYRRKIAQMTSNVFAKLDLLRLSTDAPSVSGTSEILTHVPVRKPNSHEFFRTHPDPDVWFNTGVFEDKEEREIFFVTPAMRDALMGEVKPVILAVTINSQSVLSLWPLKLPNDEMRHNAWSETAREAAELAKTHWVRVKADMSLGGYRIYKAEGQLSEPEWPNKPLNELLELAFRGRIIDSVDHPVVRRLRGLA
jgi:hypothetical protein